MAGLHAQETDGDLYRTIAELDKALFASASFDSCDIEKFTNFFAPDLEFYHDQSGVTKGSATLAAQVKQNLCGTVRRELIEGTMKVFPMKGYGAVQTGEHRFYQPKKQKNPTGKARFIHLWQNQDGHWRITRVISYDHVALP